MTIPPHTLLGPYEILAPIGAGGMGEVYLARDPRLEREVAIKVLSSSFGSDEIRMKRFQQEARAVALLNHPNILQIYDTGVHEGTPYLVMELLTGQSLRSRMDGKPMPLRKAVDLAIQIARGLAVAHDKGIIHRDLKPENIHVSPEGQVKILDFGLAKLLAPPPDDTRPTGEHETLSMLTRIGTVVGTAGYMSPEQVSGSDIDCRSDLFCLGIILWEMVMGLRPFRGDSAVEVMHAILKEDPMETMGSRLLPPAIERILNRCMEKEPAARFQNAQDLAFNLESACISGLSTTTEMATPPPRKTYPRWIKGLSLGLGILALTGGAWWMGRSSGDAGLVTFHRLTYRHGIIRSARLAKDGQTYVYSMAQETAPAELMAGRIDSVGSRSLHLPPNAEILSISSQGQMALLLKDGAGLQGTLATAPLAGGAPRPVLDHVLGADWDPQGQDFAVIRTNTSGSQCIDYPIGHRLLDAEGSTQLSLPKVSPDGNFVAFLEDKGIDKGALAIVDREGHKRVLVNGTCGSMQWAPNGKVIYFTLRHFDDRQDVRSVTLSGRQRVLDTVMGRVRIHDVSRSGRLLLEHCIWKTSLFLSGSDQKGERDLSWLQSSLAADLSVNGKQVLFGETREGMNPIGAYLRNTDGSDAIRLGDGDPLALSSDGQWALVSPGGALQEVAILPTGTGSPRYFKGLRADWGVFLPGGRYVLVGGVDGTHIFKNFLLDMRTGEWNVWAPPGRVEAYCVVSPDGTRVALGPVDGKLNIYSLEGRLLTSVAGLQENDWVSQWSADGKSVYILDPSHLPAKVFLFDLATGKRALWKEIAPSDRTGVERIKTFAITPDGHTMAYSFVRTLVSDLYVTDPL